MNKFTVVAATSHTLSVAALEEASRLGEPIADIDHLLLALTITEQLAGQVLRASGITLDAARDAVAAQHAEQLAGLGIAADPPPAGRITFHETTARAEWSERALTIFQRASERDRRGDAAAVLRELLGEPSGLVDAVLGKLGTDAVALRDRLDRAEATHAPSANVAARDALTGHAEAFVPAPPAEVWALLLDPTRTPEWDPMVSAVDDLPETATPGSTWTMHARRSRRSRPNGRVSRRHAGVQTGVTRLDDAEPPHRVTWTATWPDAPKANARRLTIGLEPAAGGTHLRLSLAWVRAAERHRSPKRLLAPIMRPLQRYAVWFTLNQIGSGIGRAFR